MKKLIFLLFLFISTSAYATTQDVRISQINAALPTGTNVIGHVIADSGTTTVVTGNVTNVGTSASFVLSGTSPASATTAASTTITGLNLYSSLTVYYTVQGGTGGTLDIYLQVSPDAGTTWVDYAHFAQLADGASAVTREFTVSRAGQQTTVSTVGTNLNPALSGTTVIGGNFTDRMRVVYVAGASTSA